MISAIFGSIGGYVSARVYKSFGGEAWKRNIIMTPLLIPGFIFGMFFLLNLFVWAKGSSGAVPFGTMLALLLIWFVISVPLSVAGSWVGFRQKVRYSSLILIALILISQPLFRPMRVQPRPTRSLARCPQWLVACALFPLSC